MNDQNRLVVIGALIAVLVAMIALFAATESNMVGTITGLYAIAAGIVMGVLLVQGEPEGSAEAGPQPEPADDDTTPAVAGSGEPGTG